MATRLPGNLAVLPPELVWEILDHLFIQNCTEEEGLTHGNICYLHNLLRTHKDFAVNIDAYLSRTTTGQLIRQAIQSDVCFTYKSGLEALMRATSDASDHPIGVQPQLTQRFTEVCDYARTFKESTGLVTNVIIDDCPSCFMLLRKLMPELEIDGTWINKDGWSLVSIAACSGSLKMIEYFCSIESSNGSCIQLLARPPVIREQIVESTLVHIMGTCGRTKPQFIRDLFTFLLPRLHELSIPGDDEHEMRSYERSLLCKFLTVDHAVELEKAGMPLYYNNSVVGSKAGIDSCYYWAAANACGPELLEYIHQRASAPTTGADGTRAIDYAVLSNRLDNVIWLQAHGAGDTYDMDGLKESWLHSTARIAAKNTSEESIEILKALLCPLDPGQFPPLFCPLMLESVVDGLEYKRRNSAAGTNIFKQETNFEAWAIRKCKHIISTFAKDVWGSTEAKVVWKDVARRSWHAGLSDLAACIEAGMPRD